MGRVALGKTGEAIAERHLLDKGYRIVARRWTCRTGELDLVAVDGGEVVFVEVKTRSGHGYGAPEESVTRAKRARLRSAARAFLDAARRPDAPYRIDVVAVETDAGEVVVRHLVSAVGEVD